jgi:DNA repair photolyase
MFYNRSMTRPHYIETTCKSALNRVSGMPFRWSLNPYRGCLHGCHYCYARATHSYLGLNADDDFSNRIIVKTNMPEVLRRELRRPSWEGERVALGTATDAYQPCEGRFRITRHALEALRDYATPVSLVTKSTLVVRDLDLLRELAHLPGTRVNFSITTLDPRLWRLVEPGTPSPMQRLRVMRQLAEAGILCGVFVAPVLPGLTDGDGMLEVLAVAAREHGASAIWASPLRLAPLVKEHYLTFLAESFPELLASYERAYSHADPPRAYGADLEDRLVRIRAEFGFTASVPLDRKNDFGAASAANLVGQAVTRQIRLPLSA